MSKRRALILIQWSVSSFLVWYLLTKIDFNNSLLGLKNVDVVLLLVSVLQLAIQPVLGALRWQIIVRALGGRLKFSTSLCYVWIGAFFSQALPGAVGGDVVRIWLYSRQGKSRRTAINSVALERIIMILSLLLLVVIVQRGLVVRSGSLIAAWLPPVMLAVGLSGTGILMLADRLTKFYGESLPFRAVTYLAVDARKILLGPLVFSAVTFISIAAYLNMAVTAWLIALALGISLSLADCLVLMPVIFLASTLPISIGGWGVREGAMIVLFGTVGVSSAQALTLSVLFGVIGIVVSLPGVAIWLIGGYRRSELAQAVELADRKAL